MDRFKGNYRIPSARLKEWDYAAAGYYFVTICTAKHQPFFGEITDGEMCLSLLGGVAEKFWIEISIHFSHVDLDEFVIMPNHVHGIVVINEHATTVETQHDRVETQHDRVETQHDRVETQHDRVETQHAASLQKKPTPGSLSTIIRSYKSAVTRWAGQNSFSAFAWQARFYDHIIRNERSLEKIRAYILGNPALWEVDEYCLKG